MRVNGATNDPLAWPNASRLRLAFGAAEGAFVEIERVTPIDEALVKFQDGNVLTGGDLNTAVLQVLYRQQETTSLYNRTVGSAKQRLAAANGLVVPTEDVLDTLIQSLLENDALAEFEAATADISANAQAIIDEIVARQGSVDQLAQRADGIVARADEQEAALVQFDTARADGEDSAASSTIALMAARRSTRAKVLQEISVNASAIAAEATRIDIVTAEIANTAALVASEQTARVSADEALAASVSAVSTELDGLQASIVETSASVDGLLLQHSVLLNSNGHISGFVQNNNGVTGEFIVVADTFKVVTPDGAEVRTPFQVTQDGVRIDGNLVVTGSITTDGLAANSVTKGSSSFTAAELGIPQASYGVVQTCDLTTTGGEVRVDFSGAFFCRSYEVGDFPCHFRIKRGSDVIHEGILCDVPGILTLAVHDGQEQSAVIGQVDVPSATTGTYHVFFVDTAAPAGTHTYSIELVSPVAATIASRQMALLELKK